MTLESTPRRLSDVCKAIVDCEHRTAPAGDGDARSIGTGDIRNGRIDLNSAKRVSEETWREWSRRLVPRDGDLVLAREAPVGEVGRVPAGAKVCLGQRTVLLRPDEDRVDGRYLHYLMLGPAVRAELLRLAAGSTVHHLNVADIKTLRLPPMPSRAEQQRIVGVLGALDDKIEHNVQLSERLARVALLGFEAQRSRWLREGSIGDLGSPMREAAVDGAPYIGLEHMPRGSTILAEWAEGAAVENSVAFRRGDVLFGKLRPYFKKVGVAPLDGRCSTEILILRPNADHLWGPLLGYISSEAFIDYCVQVSRGTKMPRSEWKDASTFRIRVPDETEAAELTTQMRAFYEAAVALVHESKTLRSLRDALLPKLISGAIRVPDSYDSDDALDTVAEAGGVAIS